MVNIQADPSKKGFNTIGRGSPFKKSFNMERFPEPQHVEKKVQRKKEGSPPPRRVKNSFNMTRWGVPLLATLKKRF